MEGGGVVRERFRLLPDFSKPKGDLEDKATSVRLCEAMSLKEGTMEWRDIMVRTYGRDGLKASWLSHYGKHLQFERADREQDFDAVFAMLSESEDVRDYLCWHMKMTRDCFGPYEIESHAAFAPLLHLVVGAGGQ